MVDQLRLPQELVMLEYTDYHDVADAIRTMKIRGAPAIGAAAAFGLALAVAHSSTTSRPQVLAEFTRAADVLGQTRPTAVNLFWAIARMNEVANDPRWKTAQQVVEAVVREAQRIADEDVETNRCMGAHGSILIQDGDNILTHCNAGALATVDYGTTLGVVRAAHEQGKRIHVWVDETRPYLQGARLTAWELLQAGIPATLITDNMAGHFMSHGKVDIVLVGADRIAANGDVANKIGTYSLAVLAKENGIPFYSVAPTSTIDLHIDSGGDIPIEERDPKEVTHIRGVCITAEGVKAAHPAFDVTPHRYVTGIVTETGIIYPPFAVGLKRAKAHSSGVEGDS
ncbi:MAG: S-methyl-5-thioribose-1-phosphate isomerase [Chloroflexi bacterium]|nr:S-methyl-5-thioribose-1-phosphate isomerase [Chloroflexota bacterium]